MDPNFNWANFEAGFLCSILKNTYRWDRARKYKDSVEMLAGDMFHIWDEPDSFFVESYHFEIVHYVAQKHPVYTREAFREVFPRELSWPELFGEIEAGAAKKKSVVITRLLNLMFMVGGNSINAVSDFCSKRILKLRTEEELPPVELYDFQKQAIDDLSKSYFRFFFPAS